MLSLYSLSFPPLLLWSATSVCQHKLLHNFQESLLPRQSLLPHRRSIKEHVSSKFPLFQPQQPSEHPHPPLVLRPLSAGRPLHGCFCNASWPPAMVTECCLTYVSIRMESKVEAGLHHQQQEAWPITVEPLLR